MSLWPNTYFKLFHMIYVGITCIFFIWYDVWFDIRYLVPYRDISLDIRYSVYNFGDWYIADIQYLKHYVCLEECEEQVSDSRELVTY